MSNVEILVHAHYAIAVDAAAVCKGIREEIPDWQPMIVPGFQGRMVIVVQEYSHLKDGREDGERQLRVFAMGTDGEVRKHYALVRDTVVEGGVIAITDASSAATASAWDALCDMTLANAMPIRWLDGLESMLRFHLSKTALTAEKTERLEAYRSVSIAPSRVRSAAGDAAEVWNVNFGLLPKERLYAMAEVFAGAGVLEVEPGTLNRPGLEILRDAYGHWYREEVLHLAA